MTETPANRDGDFELVTLKNGARAVRHLGHGEVMHPSVGPWEEACALYVDQSRLAEKLAQPGPPLHIWDVGLGAGTNAIAALSCARALGAQQLRPLKITSFELDLAPLRLALADAEGFPFLQPFARAALELIGEQRFSDGLLNWELQLGDAEDHFRQWNGPPAELIFFDPFSPVSNPSLWTPDAFRLLRRHTREEAPGCREGYAGFVCCGSGLHSFHLQRGHSYSRVTSPRRLLRGHRARDGDETRNHRGSHSARATRPATRPTLARTLAALVPSGTARHGAQP